MTIRHLFTDNDTLGLSFYDKSKYFLEKTYHKHLPLDLPYPFVSFCNELTIEYNLKPSLHSTPNIFWLHY